MKTAIASIHTNIDLHHHTSTHINLTEAYYILYTYKYNK